MCIKQHDINYSLHKKDENCNKDKLRLVKCLAYAYLCCFKEIHELLLCCKNVNYHKIFKRTKKRKEEKEIYESN